MGVLKHLKPARVFHYFEEICGIPHGSGNTRQISDLSGILCRSAWPEVPSGALRKCSDLETGFGRL